MALSIRASLVVPTRQWLQARSHLNTALQLPSPASLEIETMPYPSDHPDASVFEPMSDEYTSASASSPYQFTPLSSSGTLASLVLRSDFYAAESLRKEMLSHHIPIPRDGLYLRAALHAISDRRSKTSAKTRLDTFEAWLSLAPDRHEEWQSFYDIRQRLFRSMDHLNLALVYRFGLVLASKGYHFGNAAMQVVSTLARYARPTVVARYLRQVEEASREYYSKKSTVTPSDLLVDAYSLAVRTLALASKTDATLGLISIAHTRGIRISDFTLRIVVQRAPDQQVTIDRIQAVYPSWVWTSHPPNLPHTVSIDCEAIPAGHSGDITTLAARLRSLRVALRSPSPPSPHALHHFIASYHALGRTRATALLRSIAYRHSPKSASTWAFTEMLHHRSRREAIHVLVVFSQHFHPVGIPRKTLLSLIRGTRGQNARKERVGRWVVPPFPMKEKLWPSAYHTALAWDAIVSLSPKADKERLYSLLLSLVRQSKHPELGLEDHRLLDTADHAKLQLPPDAYDSAHFSPFVSAWARSNPARAASVLRNMTQLGIGPTLIQWSMVARGYAQHDDPAVALRILDHLADVVKRERGDDVEGDPGERLTSDTLLGVHTNVLRGFVIAGDVQHAREVERRLVEQLGYQTGQRFATDAGIALLRRLEDNLSAS